MRRVVVTGLGTVCPVGNNTETSWKNILAGLSGIGPITRFDTEGFSCRIAGEVKNFDPAPAMTPKDARRYDLFIQYAVAAGAEAFGDAGLEGAFEPERAGVCIGSGIGGLDTIDKNVRVLMEKGPRRVSPFLVPGIISNMPNGLVSIRYGFKGPTVGHVSACSTGLHAIGEAACMIIRGDADVMIAGGSEAIVTPVAVAGFDNMHALSRRNDEPQKASRPFDSGRDGFVIGEGAGVLVLEELSHAQARNAKIYAELVGYGMSSDAYHITTPTTEGPVISMRNALRHAGISPSDIDYLNAHGTSTVIGDVNESKAIAEVFSGCASSLTVSSTKSMTGHLLGGAGGVESVFTVLAIRDQVCPPTINLDSQDPECTLDYCPNVRKNKTIRYAMKNSFGFGGTNGTLIFKRYIAE